MTMVLFTGVPGTGKTAFIVNKLIDEAAKGRKIYCSGIPELQVMHEVCGDMLTWQKGDWLKINHYDPLNDNQEGWRPREIILDENGVNTNAAVDCGAIIVVDECQRFFRGRPAGAKVPDYISAFEVHRKQGLEFWLISQRPGQVDSHVRGLCDTHYGIWANWYGRFLYEWSQVHNIDNKAERDLAKKTRYKIPKRAFHWYKSAEVHGKPAKHGAPAMVVFFGLLCLLMGFIAVKGYASYQNHTAPPVAASSVASGSIHVSGGSLVESLPVSGVPDAALMDAELKRWKPSVPGRPETAPAFSDIRKVTAMPLTAACLHAGDKCLCYTQQASRIPDISNERCLQILEQGGLFNPYSGSSRQPGDVAVGGAPSVSVPPSSLPSSPLLSRL